MVAQTVAWQETGELSMRHIFCLVAVFWTFEGNCLASDKTDFFEQRIRPVLIERCYECHNSTDAAEGGLKLDFRQGLLSGGDSGPAVVPGKPSASLPRCSHISFRTSWNVAPFFSGLGSALAVFAG